MSFSCPPSFSLSPYPPIFSFPLLLPSLLPRWYVLRCYTPSKFSILSTLLRARFKYSSCFRRPTFSAREEERGREREREGKEREEENGVKKGAREKHKESCSKCPTLKSVEHHTYSRDEVILEIKDLEIATPPVQMLDSTRQQQKNLVDWDTHCRLESSAMGVCGYHMLELTSRSPVGVERSPPE